MHFKSNQTSVETNHLWSNLNKTYYDKRTKLIDGEQQRLPKGCKNTEKTQKTKKKRWRHVQRNTKNKNGTIKNIDGLGNQNKLTDEYNSQNK